MKTIFFNNLVGTNKLSFTNTNKTVEHLREVGVIPEGAATLVVDFPPDSDVEMRAALAHVDKLVFDDPLNPTAVVFDMELVDLWWKEVYRAARAQKLLELDSLQVRAMAKGLTSLVAQMEADKQLLRDIPVRIDHSNDASFQSTLNKNPEELFVDYDEKYRPVLL